jgi:hypothetical protein
MRHTAYPAVLLLILLVITPGAVQAISTAVASIPEYQWMEDSERKIDIDSIQNLTDSDRLIIALWFIATLFLLCLRVSIRLLPI